MNDYPFTTPPAADTQDETKEVVEARSALQQAQARLDQLNQPINYPHFWTPQQKQQHYLTEHQPKVQAAQEKLQEAQSKLAAARQKPFRDARDQAEKAKLEAAKKLEADRKTRIAEQIKQELRQTYLAQPGATAEGFERDYESLLSERIKRDTLAGVDRARAAHRQLYR